MVVEILSQERKEQTNLQMTRKHVHLKSFEEFIDSTALNLIQRKVSPKQTWYIQLNIATRI